MTNKLILTVSQASKLERAFMTAGFTPTDVDMLCRGELLPGVRSLLRGSAVLQLVPIADHSIDCDAVVNDNPRCKPTSRTVTGTLQWNVKAQSVAIHQSSSQIEGDPGYGIDVYHELAREVQGRFLNHAVLHHLLAHQECIPEEWKGKHIFFWGNLVWDTEGDALVYYLRFDEKEDKWVRGSMFHDVKEWQSDYYAAMTAE